MELCRANKNDYRLIKKLYISAFPREIERTPSFMLKKRAFFRVRRKCWRLKKTENL